MTAHPHLFQPLKLRHKTLRNRVVFGAHTTNMAVDGLPTDQHVAYYRERALGGAAMIVVEPMPVHAAAILTRGNFRHSSDEVIPAFRRLTEAAKSEGAVVLQQLYHVGAHGDWDNSWHANWSPSGGPSYHDNDGSHAMTEAEIEETIDAFVQAARRCQEAGFDGVEVWAAYNCLLDQFWAPFSNQRTDDWGGNLENRTRFSREIMRRIRALCGDEFIIGLSISDEPEVEAALSRDEMVEIVALHDAEGLMDYVTCGTGSYFDFTRIIPSFQEADKLGVDLATRLKGVLKHARVTAESLIRTPDNANTVIGAGEADLVSLVRGQIADPHWVNKTARGRWEEVRGCLSCNQQCWGRRGRDYWISCLVNPSVGREHEWGGDRFSPAEEPGSILVVGGGPAGLEAARVAAERGHKVTLAEAAPDLGGQFRLAGMQPRRAQITDLIDWYGRQLENLGVEIRYNAYLDADDVRMMNVDQVVLATGALPDDSGFQKAVPHKAGFDGADRANVCSVEDIMSRAVKPGAHVVVLDEGGHWRGVGTAWHLAEAGHQLTIVTADAVVAGELHRSATDFKARAALAAKGARFVTETVLTKWDADGAEITSLLTGETSRIAADTLVLALGRKADPDIANALRAAGQAPIVIGDGLAPRNAAAAIFEGRQAGLSL